jgi:WD40 repeat protein
LLVADNQHVVGLDAASGKELFSWRMEPLQNKSRTGEVVRGQPVDQADRNAWRTLAVSPEGTLGACILSGETRMEGRIALFEARTGRIIRRWNDSGHPSIMFEQLSFSHDERLLASSDGPVIHLWEVATGKEICTFQGHRGEIRSLAFSSNGRRLASASTDGTVLLWDLAPAAPLLKEANEKEVAGWWADLASEEPSQAYGAVWHLVEVPATSIAFLRQRLKPTTDAQEKEILQHIENLDSHTAAVREKASQQLDSLGVAATAALRQALTKNVSAEVSRRIEQLLEKQTNKPLSGEPLRTVRALAVLEHAGAPEARQLLQELSAGASGAWLTKEAKASLERLAKRP